MKPVAYVAEDASYIRCMMVERLEALGFAVKTGCTGWEATRDLCDQADPANYAAVVLDNNLLVGPKGTDILLRMRDMGRMCPIVLHSGDWLEREAKASGAFYLSKPSTPREFRQALELAGVELPEVVA